MSRQLTCPKCNHEFTFDNGYYDENITRLGQEIHDINRQLADHKLLSWPEQKARSDWYHRARRSLYEKQKELGELKAIRKMVDQQIDKVLIEILKDLIREELGERKGNALITKALEQVEGYKASDLMRHEYTRSNHKSGVISVGKL